VVYLRGRPIRIVYRASDRLENERWLADLQRAAERLDLGSEARSNAEDLFLSTVPENDRSKPAAVAASLYAGSLIAGDQRSQGDVADAVGVTRLTIQQRWKPLLERAGLEPPTW
jgi:transcription initiation factor TFIIIB Brf1 subunit/transcription initiation factor TFIIB